MTFTENKTTVRVPNGTREPVWKNPVNGHDYRNDPLKDNHLFDFKNPVYSKNEFAQIKQILYKLNEYGAEFGFNPDFKTNPNGKMRCTMHSGRTRKKDRRSFSTKHNDRNFDSDADHIAKDRTGQNVVWSWCGTDISFDEGELKYYEETFGEQLKQTNINYIKARHKERCKTMDEWRREKMHAPEEQILQIGRMEQYPDVEVSLKCFNEYLVWLNDWNEQHGNPFFIMNWAMHQDEMGAPHFHLRRAWPCLDDKTGLITTDQTKALLNAGIPLPDPVKPIGKRNNPKMVFDKMCRDKWVSIARSHGLEIEDTPKPKSEVGKDLATYQHEQDLRRNEIFRLLCNLTQSNIEVMEKISEWEELVPSIENYSQWARERCQEAQHTYREDQLDKIVKQFEAAYANSTKAVKDEYENQIKQYDEVLNGYTKQTPSGTKRVFGAAEVRQMFESATAEQLQKIAGILKAQGLKDVKEWMQTNYWYREFELGRDAEREMEREKGRENLR